jgi:hypothetical protein
MPVEIKQTPGSKDDLNTLLAVKVLQAQYPDILQRLQNKMFATDQSLGPGVNGTYNYDTKEVAVKNKHKPFTTDNVVATLQTMLHELTHAEQDTPAAKKTMYSEPYGNYKDGRELAPGRVGQYDEAASKSQLSTLQDAKNLQLPSSSEENTGELIANLMANRLLKERNIHGPFEVESDSLESNPDVKNWVDRNMNPQVPSVQTWQPSIGSQVLDGIKGMLGMGQK